MKIFLEYPQLLDELWVEGYDFSDSWTKKNPDENIGELDCAVAIMKTGGVLGDMLKLLGRSRAQIVGFIGKNPHLEELVDEVNESFLDEVEKLHKTAALQGDLQAQRFILQTLGKKRGYVTRQEQDVKAKTQVVLSQEDSSL